MQIASYVKLVISLLAGIRIREGNIQIGKSDVLADAFSEPRFNSWSVGELHIVARQLVPTGRRDDFEVNAKYADFKNKVSTYTKSIAKICRQKSTLRNRLKEFGVEEDKIRLNLKVLGQGAISKPFKKELKNALSVSLNKMSTTAKGDPLPSQTREKLLSKVESLSRTVNQLELFDHSEDPLANYSPQKRGIYQNIFSLIYECSGNRVVAQKLVKNILLRLT